MAERLFHCPQCGEDTNELPEGYCPECGKENQRVLHEHNLGFDRWQRLSPAQREAEIRNAIWSAASLPIATEV